MTATVGDVAVILRQALFGSDPTLGVYAETLARVSISSAAYKNLAQVVASLDIEGLYDVFSTGQSIWVHVVDVPDVEVAIYADHDRGLYVNFTTIGPGFTMTCEPDQLPAFLVAAVAATQAWAKTKAAP